MKREIRWWQALALFILIAGIVLTLWSAQLQDQSMRKDLLIKTSIAKTGVSIRQFEALSGSPADLSTPGYQALKNQLEKIRAADPGIRFTYLMGLGQDGTILIYADSEPPGSAGNSPPGQGYTEAPAVIRSVFATGNVASEGPYTDRWGTWVSGFVPVTDPATGEVIAVFGMDVDARDWNAAIAQSCAAIVTASLLILVLVIVSGLTRQRGRREQHRLETSEAKFSKVFHANPALMVVSTIEEGQILDVNTSFLETLGYSRKDVLWKTTSELGLYYDPGKRDAIIAQLKEKGWVRNMDLEIYRKNQDLLYGSLSAITIDVAGTPRLLTVIADYSERKRAEDAFRLKEKKYRLLIENSHDVIYTLNTEGLFTFISPSWTQLLGHPITQVIGKPFRQFVHPDDSPECLAFMQRVIREGQRQTGIEYRVKHADGSWRWHTTNAVPIRDDSGTIIGGEGCASDITMRKVAEKALIESEEEFRGIFDMVNDGIHVHEIEPDGRPGRFIRVNEVACRMLQYTREELLEHGPLDYVTGYHSRPLNEILDELSSTGHSIFETRHRRKDGTTVPVEINAHLVSQGGKRVIVSVVRDITER